MALTGKIAVVTGAGGGIGSAVCQFFAQEGAKIVATDINPDTLTVVVEGLHGDPSHHLSKCADITSFSSVAALTEAVMSKYGEGPSIIVNTAGIQTFRGGILNCDEAIWDKTVGVHLKGTYLINRAFISIMVRESIKGSVINFSSDSSAGAPKAPDYSAAKAGIEGFTKAVAKEMAPYGIRVNVVQPGPIDTPMVRKIPNEYEIQCAANPLGRIGEPIEVAQLCCFLAGDKSAFITGSIYPITGGYTR